MLFKYRSHGRTAEVRREAFGAGQIRLQQRFGLQLKALDLTLGI